MLWFACTAAPPQVSIVVHTEASGASEVLVVVNDADGQWVSTSAPDASGDLSLSVPEGASVSVVRREPRLDRVFSVLGVREGDELWFRDPLEVEVPSGSWTLEVTDPGVPHSDVIVSTGNCGGWSGSPLPIDDTAELWDDCYDGTGALNVVASVRTDVGYAVAAHTDVPIEGEAPALQGAAVLADWDLDPAVVGVRGPGVGAFHEVAVEGWRRGLRYVDQAGEQAAELPVPAGVFDAVRLVHRSLDPVDGGTSWRESWEVLDGVTASQTVDAPAVGPELSASVDWKAGVVTLDVPEACGDLGPYAVAIVQLQVAGVGQRLLQWTVVGPGGGTLVVPALEPESAPSLAGRTGRASAIVAVQTAHDLGFDGIRNDAELWRLPVLPRSVVSEPGTRGCDSQTWLDAVPL